MILVHHARKNSSASRPGQALRGSSELRGWGDSNFYMRRKGPQLTLSTEDRAAPSQDHIPLELDSIFARIPTSAVQEGMTETKKELPAWSAALFHQFLDRNERLTQVLHLSIAGISMVRGRPEAIKVLAKIEGLLDGKVQDSEGKLRLAESEKELAQREVDHDFPLLHEQGTIALWSSLEALVRSFVANWLANIPEAWQVEAVKKLRIKLGDYESLERFERCLWIADLVDQEVSGPLRNGVSRSESLLQPFGLSGNVDPKCQKTLFELSQIRHLLVHRNGVVDRKLIEACPWLGFESGNHLKVSHKMWHAYNNALGEYVFELIQRLRVYFGLIRYDEREHAESTDLNAENTFPL